MDKLLFTWTHKDANGNIIGEIKRSIDDSGRKKDLPFYIPNGKENFSAGTTDEMKNKGNPLFGLETVVDKAKPIIIVEGQKCAYALKGLGYQCVSSILGASNPIKTNWKPLGGIETIYFLPDEDSIGQTYIKQIWTILNSFKNPPIMRIIKLPNLPTKGDVCDWLKMQPELQEWNELSLLSNHPAKEIIHKRLQQIIDHNLHNIPTEWDYWPETKPLQREIPDPEEFPIEALGDALSQAAKKIVEVIHAPLGICGQSVLAAAALAVQAYGDLVIDGRKSPLSEFFLTVGETGERKSAVDRVVLQPHSTFQRTLNEKYMADISKWTRDFAAYEATKKQILGPKNKSYEDKLSALKTLGDPPEKPLEPLLIAEEPTYEGLVKLLANGQPSIGLFSDEGGRFIGGYACNADNLLKTASGLCGLWDGKPISRVRSGDGASQLSE